MQRFALVIRQFVFRPLVIFIVAGLGLIAFLLLVNQAWAAADRVAPDAPGSISGLVTDDAGTPAAGIEVTLLQQQAGNYWLPGRTVQTDATGHYKFSFLGAGIYRLRFRDPTGVLAQLHYPGTTLVETATDLPVAGVDVTNINMKLPLGGRISGQITRLITSVTDLGGLSPYVYVYLLQKNGLGWAKVSGLQVGLGQVNYTLTGLPAGVYRLCTSSMSLDSYPQPYPPSYFDPNQECYDNVYAPEDGTALAIAANTTMTNVNFVLGDGADLATMQGVVTNKLGEPLQGIMVNAYSQWGASAQTNSSGLYTLTNLSPGRQSLSFYDFSGAYISAFIEPPLAITVTHRQHLTGVNLQLATASHITGRLTVQGDNPPYGAIFAYRKTSSGWQNSMFYPVNFEPGTGKYNLGGLPAGVYKLGAQGGLNAPYGPSYNGYYGGDSLETATPLTVITAETLPNINFNLTGPLPFTSAFSGVVTANGTPVPGIKVALYANNCCAVLSMPLPGEIPLPTSTATPAAAVNAARNGQANQPQATHALQAIPIVYVYTDASGRYTLQGLTDGQYAVGFSDPAGVYATTYYENQPVLPMAQLFWLQGNQVQLPTGATKASVDAALTLGGGIGGSVHLKDGTPLANVAVTLYLATPNNGLQGLANDNQTDENGNFLVKGLPAGVYYLCFSDLTAHYPFECYGASSPLYAPDSGVRVVVQSGAVTSGINQILGPKEPFFLPLILR